LPKFFAVRSSDLTRTLAEVDIKTARGMVARGEAEWTGNTRSIKLVTKQQPEKSQERDYSRQPGRAIGLSARPNAKLIERYLLAKNSGADGAAIVAVEFGIGGPRRCS
jgi:hypothetical protein